MTHTDKIEVRIIKHQSKTIAKAIFVLHTVNNETDKLECTSLNKIDDTKLEDKELSDIIENHLRDLISDIGAFSGRTIIDINEGILFYRIKNN